MVKSIAIDCCHFIKRKVIVYSDIKIGGFQQDGAPSHTDNRAQQWCKNNFRFFIPKEKWPPNSPELNPMDYSIWTKISSDVEYGRIKTINDLRREIEKAITKIDICYIREVIGAFLRRVYSVEKTWRRTDNQWIYLILGVLYCSFENIISLFYSFVSSWNKLVFLKCRKTFVTPGIYTVAPKIIHTAVIFNLHLLLCKEGWW